MKSWSFPTPAPPVQTKELWPWCQMDLGEQRRKKSVCWALCRHAASSRTSRWDVFIYACSDVLAFFLWFFFIFILAVIQMQIRVEFHDQLHFKPYYIHEPGHKEMFVCVSSCDWPEKIPVWYYFTCSDLLKVNQSSLPNWM